MKLKNKLLLATIISLGVYIFLVYVAIKIFLYPELIKSELSSVYEKEQKSEILIKQELQNLKDLTNIIAINQSSYKDSIDFSTITDFIYIAKFGNEEEENFFISKKLKSNKKLDENEIKSFIKNYITTYIQPKKEKSDNLLINDIVNTKSGALLLALKEINNENNIDTKIIIVGQFLKDSIISKINYGTGWNIKLLFDKKLIDNLLAYKENSKSNLKENTSSKKLDKFIDVIEKRELMIDKSQLKSFYLIKVGTFKRDIVLEVSVKEGLIYHSNIILIFTFLATLLSGPLALLFLILIVRIIQAHEV